MEKIPKPRIEVAFVGAILFVYAILSVDTIEKCWWGSTRGRGFLGGKTCEFIHEYSTQNKVIAAVGIGLIIYGLLSLWETKKN